MNVTEYFTDVTDLSDMTTAWTTDVPPTDVRSWFVDVIVKVGFGFS